MSEPRPSPGSAPGRALAVVGASGGVGTTTLVAAVGAQVVRGGRSCAVVDLQRGGGGLDVPYAVEHLPGVRWVDLAHVDGPVDGAALLPRLPSAGGVRVLAHAREPGPVPGPTSCAEVIDGLRANVDSVVLDAPRDLTDELPAASTSRSLLPARACWSCPRWRPRAGGSQTMSSRPGSSFEGDASRLPSVRR